MARRKSNPISKVNYDSDENQIEYLNYNEPKYYGWVDDCPSPVQVKRPNPRSNRPGEQIHLAVWDENPYLVQKMVLAGGNFLYFTAEMSGFGIGTSVESILTFESAVW